MGGFLCSDALAEEAAALEEDWLVPLSKLPEYEANIDHARILDDWGERSLARGKQVYQRVCQSCHGDSETLGSLPQTLRFSEGEFQRGSDPHSMYTVVTRGWRMMPPQSQLSPIEKYDVIHYIREVFMKSNESLGVAELSESYLSSLPQGTSLGPASKKNEPWKDLDYGSFLINTYELGDAAGSNGRETEAYPNIVYKGIATRLDDGNGGVAAGRTFSVFDQDTLRLAGAWSGLGFIDWRGIQFDGQHHSHPRIVGELLYDLPDGPGWAHPETQSFEDGRLLGLDGRHYGPLPRDWGRYLGLYQHGERVVLSYRVGDAKILESSRIVGNRSRPTLVRVLNVERSTHDLFLRVARVGTTVRATSGAGRLRERDGFLVLEVRADETPLDFELYLGAGAANEQAVRDVPENLTPLTKGGPSRWPQRLAAPVETGVEGGPFLVDEIVRPLANPWGSELRMTGLDFLDDGRAAVVCTWDGEVWKVEGIQEKSTDAKWRRIASG
ncbi:cytochrome c [Pelagicoccus enzymogenes]|nr:cytochrome c [Pelagicoccus enzymogenes]